MLASLVFGLFGLMHVCAALAYAMVHPCAQRRLTPASDSFTITVSPHPQRLLESAQNYSSSLLPQDARYRTKELRQLLRVDPFGFKQHRGSGAWTWHCKQGPLNQELQDGVGQVRGPLADLAAVIGIPVVRFRCAIPQELWAGHIGASHQRCTTRGSSSNAILSLLSGRRFRLAGTVAAAYPASMPCSFLLPPPPPTTPRFREHGGLPRRRLCCRAHHVQGCVRRQGEGDDRGPHAPQARSGVGPLSRGALRAAVPDILAPNPAGNDESNHLLRELELQERIRQFEQTVRLQRDEIEREMSAVRWSSPLAPDRTPLPLVNAAQKGSALSSKKHTSRHKLSTASKPLPSDVSTHKRIPAFNDSATAAGHGRKSAAHRLQPPSTTGRSGRYLMGPPGAAGKSGLHAAPPVSHHASGRGLSSRGKSGSPRDHPATSVAGGPSSPTGSRGPAGRSPLVVGETRHNCGSPPVSFSKLLRKISPPGPVAIVHRNAVEDPAQVQPFRRPLASTGTSALASAASTAADATVAPDGTAQGPVRRKKVIRRVVKRTVRSLGSSSTSAAAEAVADAAALTEPPAEGTAAAAGVKPNGIASGGGSAGGAGGGAEAAAVEGAAAVAMPRGRVLHRVVSLTTRVTVRKVVVRRLKKAKPSADAVLQTPVVSARSGRRHVVAAQLAASPKSGKHGVSATGTLSTSARSGRHRAISAEGASALPSGRHALSSSTLAGASSRSGRHATATENPDGRVRSWISTASPREIARSNGSSGSGLGVWAAATGARSGRHAALSPASGLSRHSDACTVLSGFPGRARDASFRPGVSGRVHVRTAPGTLGTTSTQLAAYSSTVGEDGEDEEMAIAARSEAMTVTALIIAFMYIARLLPVRELALRQRASAQLFSGRRVRAFDFDKLVVS